MENLHVVNVYLTFYPCVKFACASTKHNQLVAGKTAGLFSGYYSIPNRTHHAQRRLFSFLLSLLSALAFVAANISDPVTTLASGISIAIQLESRAMELQGLA